MSQQTKVLDTSFRRQAALIALDRLMERLDPRSPINLDVLVNDSWAIATAMAQHEFSPVVSSAQGSSDPETNNQQEIENGD